MGFKIENFGPIEKGSIQFKPLTILFGPNGSGKSYCAEALYNMLNKNTFQSTFFETLDEDKDLNKIREGNLDYLNKLIYVIKNEIDPIINFDEVIQKKIFERVKQIYKSEIIANFKNTFTDDFDGLIRIGTNSFNLILKDGTNQIASSYSKKTKEMRFRINYKLKPIGISATELDFEGKKIRRTRKLMQVSTENIKLNVRISPKSDEKLLFKIMCFIIYWEFNNAFISKDKIYYLPCGRTGILQSKPYIDAYARRNLLMKSSEIKSNNLIMKFLTDINRIEDDYSEKSKISKHFSDYIKEAEIRLTGGTIECVEKDNNLRNLLFNFKGQSIPMIRCSSEINEMAPLLIYFKYVLRTNDILVIEEPESHLNPENILIVAKIISRAVNSGIRIIVITHSTGFLDQINNLIVANQLSDDQLKKLKNIEKEECLDYNLVSSYFFSPSSESYGFKIEKVTIDEKNGIDLSYFINQINLFLEEYHKIFDLNEGE